MREPVKIRSRSNPGLKRFRLALEGRNRGAVLLEGVKLVGEALEGSWRPLEALVSPGLADRPGGGELLERLLAVPGPFRVLEAPERIFRGFSGVERAQGVLLLLERPVWKEEDLLGRGEEEVFLLVLCGVQDPGNVGALVRSASAAGATGAVLLPGTADPLKPKALRASAGQALSFPFLRVGSSGEALSFLETRGIPLRAAQAGSGPSFWDAPWELPLALAIGAEGGGLPREILSRAAGTVSIPMEGGVESLNLAVAGSLLLFEAARRRREGRRVR